MKLITQAVASFFFKNMKENLLEGIKETFNIICGLIF